jgi:hypothetical protein
MAAGQGFKTFTTGEVLTAADTNGYLMQGVLVFADSAARSAAITSPQEGQMSYLKSTDSTEYYSGSTWVAVGGAGGTTLLSTTTLSGSTTISSINQTYKSLYIIVKNITLSANGYVTLRINNTTTDCYYAGNVWEATAGAFGNVGVSGAITLNPASALLATGANNCFVVQIDNYASTTSMKPFEFYGGFDNNGSYKNGCLAGGYYAANTAVTSLVFPTTTQTGGTVLVYGVN